MSWRSEVATFGLEAEARPRWRFGRTTRYAVIAVDFVTPFVGEAGDEPIQGLSAGKAGSDASYAASQFLKELRRSRESDVPAIFTRPSLVQASATGGTVKHDRLVEARGSGGNGSLAWPDTFHPSAGDTVIEKAKPSAFFGTPLHAMLVKMQCEAVIIMGGTISGCVRATACDAFSLGFAVAIPEECVFDNAKISGIVNLHDLDRKYADVMPASELLAKLT